MLTVSLQFVAGMIPLLLLVLAVAVRPDPGARRRDDTTVSNFFESGG